MAQPSMSAVGGRSHAADHAEVEHRHARDHEDVSRRHLAAHEKVCTKHGNEHTALADRHVAEHEKAAEAEPRRKAALSARHAQEDASRPPREQRHMAMLETVIVAGGLGHPDAAAHGQPPQASAAGGGGCRSWRARSARSPCTASASASTHVQIQVSDEGTVPSTMRERMFCRHASAGVDGEGIGLVLAAELAEGSAATSR